MMLQVSDALEHYSRRWSNQGDKADVHIADAMEDGVRKQTLSQLIMWIKERKD